MRKFLLIALLSIPYWAEAQDADTVPRRRRFYEVEEDSVPKTDIIRVLKDAFHIKSGNFPKKGRGGVYYSLLPAPSNVPGGGTALVTSTNAAFYLGPRRTTNISNVSFSPSFSFSGRFSFSFHSNLWLEGNYRNITGDMRFIVNPQYTWGTIISASTRPSCAK